MWSETDRELEIAALKRKTEEQIHQGALADPDNLPLSDEQLAEFTPIQSVPGATLLEKYRNLRQKERKQPVSIRFDADVLDYFKAKGKGYQSIMNDVLRAFMEAELASQK